MRKWLWFVDLCKWRRKSNSAWGGASPMVPARAPRSLFRRNRAFAYRIEWSRLLPQDPAHGVVLQLDVLQIPEIAEHMAGRHVADPPLAVVVRPTSRSGGAVALISQALFIYRLEEKELGVLVISHVMLLIGNHEVFDSLRDGMI